MEIGRPYNLPQERFLGSVTQPNFGGCCHPEMHLRSHGQADDAEPFGKVIGPCCFGGWLEVCADFNFRVSFFNSPASSTDIGEIIKKKPQGCAGMCRELCTPADTFTIHFNEANMNKLAPAQKLTVLSAQMLADYMFFDGNTDKCSQDDSSIHCNLFYCSIIGALIPCKLIIPKNN